MKTCVERQPMPWRSFGGGDLVAVALAIALSGCVPIPVPYSSSEPVPDLSSRLPADLLKRSEETLVLTQSTKKHDSLAVELSSQSPSDRGPKYVIDAYFPRANELRTLNQRLTRSSESGVALLMISPMYGGSANMSHSTTSLDRICVVVRDGRAITMSIGAGSDHIQMLDANRREAIVSALRAPDPSPFKNVDGPCGVAGVTDWNQDLRARVARYIAEVSTARPAANGSAIGRILPGGWKDHATQSPGHTRIVLAPILLSDIDFGVVRTALRSSKESDIVRLLPEYASGARALMSFRLESFCAMSDNGHGVRWWSVSQTWEVFDASSSWASQEIAALRADRPGPACVPDGARAWSALERNRVIAFLETARPPEPRHLARVKQELSSLLVEPQSASRASFMLIFVDRSDLENPRAFPIFLNGVESAHLVDLLRSVPSSDLTARLVPARDGNRAFLNGFRPDLLCLVSVKGDVEKLNAIESPSWQVPEKSWDAPTSGLIAGLSGPWRDHAIEVVHADYSSSWDPESCWLGSHKTWSPDLRADVLHFLERLPTELASPAGK
jgi:hypothetical protein